MNGSDGWDAAYNTPEMRAYRATVEFQNYLRARRAWEKAYDVYQEASDESRIDARAELVAADAEQCRLLELARKTAEHRVAFGW